MVNRGLTVALGLSLAANVFLGGFLAGKIAGAARRMEWLRQRRWVLATMALTVAGLVAVPLLLTAQFAALSNRPGIVLGDTHRRLRRHDRHLALAREPGGGLGRELEHVPPTARGDPPR